VEFKNLAAPVGSSGIFLTAVESRVCAMWCSEVTASGDSLVLQNLSSEQLRWRVPNLSS